MWGLQPMIPNFLPSQLDQRARKSTTRRGWPASAAGAQVCRPGHMAATAPPRRARGASWISPRSGPIPSWRRPNACPWSWPEHGERQTATWPSRWPASTTRNCRCGCRSTPPATACPSAATCTASTNRAGIAWASSSAATRSLPSICRRCGAGCVFCSAVETRARPAARPSTSSPRSGNSDLGMLPTEQSNRKTVGLAETAARNPEAAVRMLQSVDADITAKAATGHHGPAGPPAKQLDGVRLRRPTRS